MSLEHQGHFIVMSLQVSNAELCGGTSATNAVSNGKP